MSYPMRRPLLVDLRELEFAFEFNQPEANYYLNLETGALVFVTDDDRRMLSEYGPNDPNHPSRIAADVAANSAAVYLQVPSVSSHEGYEFMRDFIETVANVRLQDALSDAINQRKPFRRFRAVLDRYPDDLERWHAYKSARVIERIRDWLFSHGIEPIDTPARLR